MAEKFLPYLRSVLKNLEMQSGKKAVLRFENVDANKASALWMVLPQLVHHLAYEIDRQNDNRNVSDKIALHQVTKGDTEEFTFGDITTLKFTGKRKNDKYSGPLTIEMEFRDSRMKDRFFEEIHPVLDKIIYTLVEIKMILLRRRNRLCRIRIRISTCSLI